MNRAAYAYSNMLNYREANLDIEAREATQQQAFHLSHKDQIATKEGTSSKVGKY